MSISFLDRLNQIFELLAAKRTPEQEKKDQEMLLRLMKEDEEKKAKKRDEKGQKPQQYRKEAKPKAKKPEEEVSKQEDAKSIAAKIEAMTDPKIILVSSTNMMMDGSTEDDAKVGYSEFKKSEDIKSILSNCVNFTNVDGIHSWIGSSKDIDQLMGTATYVGLDHVIETLPDDLLEKEEPFKELEFGKMKGVKKESKVRLDLNEAWKPVFEYLSKQKTEKEQEEEESKPEVETPEKDDKDKKEDNKKEDKKAAIIDAIDDEGTLNDLAEVWKTNSDVIENMNDADYDDIITAFSNKIAWFVKKEKPYNFDKKYAETVKKFSKAAGIDKDGSKELEDANENEESDDDALDAGDAPKVNVGKFRSLKEPHIFLLDPRKRYQDYLNFISPDEKDAKVKKASQVLIRPSVIKFLVSKKLKSQEGAPVIIYFLNGKDAADLRTELKRESRPDYKLYAVDKTMFDKDEPFSDLKLGDIAVEKILVDEMNRVWVDATSQSSGNPVPAVQASTQVPLDYFRLLNKKHREIEVYIGNQPEGSGTENTIYVLSTEQEAEAFVALVRKFKMPSLFYERLSANSDIDAGFKTIDPRTLMPSNVLILRAESKFDPKKVVELTEDNKDLMEAAQKDMIAILDEIEKIKERKDAFIKKAQEKAKGKKEDTKAAEKLTKEVAKFDDAIKQLEEQSKVTQLAILHTYARLKLGNKTKNAGTFVKNVTIGTHIAQFNANMTICFLWGSLTNRVTVDPKEVVKQLPFVKTVITSYL